LSLDAAFNTVEQFRSEGGGVLLVDKPLDWTSFDVVKKVRGLLRVKKAGHAGTLDPLATGLLILCSNKYTKQIDSFQAQRKQYTGMFILGAVTASYDAATPPEQLQSIDGVTFDVVERAMLSFTGELLQTPPMYSALQIGGQRLYHLARKGKTVEREPRAISVAKFVPTAFDPPNVRFLVECSKGTYVRSLVHDLGQALGCGAYLGELRRTAIGSYSVDSAWTLDRLAAFSKDAVDSYEQVNA